MKINKTIIVPVIIILVAGAIGFFAGSKFQTQKQTKMFQGVRPGNGNPTNMQRGDRTGNADGLKGFGGGNLGEIISVDDKSITIKMQDGSSKILLLSDSTIINKATEAAKSDLTVGEKVSVFGAANTDGSVTASSIELNPPMRNLP